MEENVYPIRLSCGHSSLKQRLPLTSRVAAASQRKSDTIARSAQCYLQTRIKYVDSEAVLSKSRFKQEKTSLDKKSYEYKKKIAEYQRLTQSRQRVIITDNGLNSDSSPQPHHPLLAESRISGPLRVSTTPRIAAAPRVATAPKVSAAPSRCSLPSDAATRELYNTDSKSIRRQCRPLTSAHMMKSLADLQNSQVKYLKQHQQSVGELENLKQKTGIQFQVKIPDRRELGNYAATDSSFPTQSILVNLRKRIKTSGHQLANTKQLYHQLSRQQFGSNGTDPDTRVTESAPPGKRQEPITPHDKNTRRDSSELRRGKDNPTFNIFYDRSVKKSLNQRKAEFEKAFPLDRTAEKSVRFTTTSPHSDNKRNSLFPDLKKKETKANITLNSYNRYLETKVNPFDTGVPPPPVERSRKLLDSNKDDQMYIWLGYKSKEDMERSLKQNPNLVKKRISSAGLAAEGTAVSFIPRLSNITEHTVRISSPDNRPESADSASSSSSEEEEWVDPRFQIFNNRKVTKSDRKNDKLTATF